ncbi:hypothetical protein CYY_004803 [Polysphondylium violaceum]|uniref:EGF-like domain-containing protein n=1 Tax=Polysphondylium violaceum TaxID=133409 RepID=A0A8J4PW76_9MYCE|nr:hypothetical protein CYY_004803 [Polysphondylium violaceum]
MMRNYKHCIVIFPFLFLYLHVTLGVAPIIEGFKPSFGTVGTSDRITILGSNFATLSAVYSNGIKQSVITSIDSTTRYFTNTAPSSLQYNIQAENQAGEKSNIATYYIAQVDVANSYQKNTDYYIVGTFDTIPDHSNLKVMAILNYPLQYLNGTHLTFKLNLELLSANSIGLYDDSTSVSVESFKFEFAPIVHSANFNMDLLYIQGIFLETNNLEISILTRGVVYPCVPSAASTSDMSCTATKRSLTNPITSFQILNKRNSKVTYYSVVFQTAIQSHSNFANGTAIFYGQFSIDLNNKLDGLTNLNINIDDIKPTQFTIIYPANAKCGYAYVGTAGLRQTNNYYVCPTPKLENVITLPSTSNGLVLTFKSYFTSMVVYGTNDNAIVFILDYQDGQDGYMCAIADSKYASGSYESTCVVPKENSFFIVAVTYSGEISNRLLVEYKPTISNCSSTDYMVPGKVTIYGTNFINQNIKISIETANCINPIPRNATQIVCNFPSNIVVQDFFKPLQVTISVGTYQISENIFLYNRPNPLIQSATSILYGSPGLVTIVGNYFGDPDIVVRIGGSDCRVTILTDTEMVCSFNSDVPSDYTTPLDVFVSIRSKYNSISRVFYYTRPTPIIKSATSTKYLVPAKVTIIGSILASDQIFVSIGGSECSQALSSLDGTSITCQFKSDVFIDDFRKPLDVFISIEQKFNSTNQVFLYINPAKNCPNGKNGELCSGHGQCNQQQFVCDCKDGWASFDCSINDGGTIIPDPNVNNDTSSTIITPSGTEFDVGIILINEMGQDDNILNSYNVGNITWNNITKQDNQYSYMTTLPNTNSTLLVKLSINPLDKRVFYNFAGDIIPILPKSIKYQVELENYDFKSTLNSLNFIFKSGVTKGESNCIYQENTDTQVLLDSLRSIQMTLNGETLVGTFSDRIILDNRPSYNKVEKLNQTEISKLSLNDQITYISISTSYFKSNVVVDPNFGVLVSNAPNNGCMEKKKFESWKIGVIVTAGVIAVSMAVAILYVLKKRKQRILFNAKLQKLNNNKF